jgi:hypothetical protein
MSAYAAPESKSHKDVSEAERLIEEAGLAPHWRLTSTNGNMNDQFAYWRLERAAGGKQEVQHRDIETVIRLAKDVDARLPLAKSIAVADGTADSTNY